MASDAIVERITKLLRLAQDQAGTAEGENAAAHAIRLQREHAVIVLLSDEVADAKPREIVGDFGIYASRELWVEQIAHVVAFLYDLAPIWYWSDTGKVGLVMFELAGDELQLAAAKRTFTLLHDFVQDEPMPRRLLHAVPQARAEAIFRAGVSHAIVTRLSRAKIQRVTQPDVEPSSQTALVPIREYHRPRHEFVDPVVGVPVQGGPEDFESGPEAALFAYGVIAGNRAFLPPVVQPEPETEP